MLRELRTQSEHNDEDLNRQRFEELKKDHQVQQEKLRETKIELDSLRTQVKNAKATRNVLKTSFRFVSDQFVGSRTRFSSFVGFEIFSISNS